MLVAKNKTKPKMASQNSDLTANPMTASKAHKINKTSSSRIMDSNVRHPE